jgi:hypothetical protein
LPSRTRYAGAGISMLRQADCRTLQSRRQEQTFVQVAPAGVTANVDSVKLHRASTDPLGNAVSRTRNPKFRRHFGLPFHQIATPGRRGAVDFSTTLRSKFFY